MKIKPHRPRSCLGWFAWVFGILLAFFAISYAIDMWRLADAWQQANALATQLGNTPERHLVSKVERDISIIPIDGACEVRVFFTTPLDPENFAAHLAQVAGSLWGGNLIHGRNMYLQLPFIVDGRNTLMLAFDQTGTLPLIREQDWYVGDDIFSSRVKVFYSELSQANAEIEYAGRQITENVAYVGVDAGRFPLWIWINKC
jgi:hypothetical protein